MFYRITELPKEALDEFSKLYQEEFGIKLSNDEIKKKALNLINLFYEINKNNNKEKYGTNTR
jgi:hypothetical protein